MNKAIFLDLDGCVNPLGMEPTVIDDDSYFDWDYNSFVMDLNEGGGMVSRLTVRYSTELMAALARFPIVWASTWCGYPLELREYADLCGLDSSEYDMVDAAKFDEWDNRRDSCGKLGAVQAYVEENDIDRFVWIDDMMGSDDRTWAADYNSLIIQPDDNKGITRLDVGAIRDHLK